ncbi:MAG: hypothetical protein FWF96_07445, partial [Kiritimatiellaeota bacterium]|nr:hypothetical protein [Kiritimatiellota bacterium]
ADVLKMHEKLENMKAMYSSASTEHKKRLIKSLFTSLTLQTADKKLEPLKKQRFCWSFGGFGG